MQRKIIISIGTVLIIAMSIGAFWYLHSDTTSSEEVIPPYEVPPLTVEYTNDTYNFSLNMPDGFTVREMPSANGVAVVFEDSDGASVGGPVGIQITVEEFDEDLRELTAARVRADIPDMQVTDPQPVEIGAQHTGLAFRSDNEAWDGASREVWFVFRGNLYQISTYERLDPLLKAIFATWKFF